MIPGRERALWLAQHVLPHEPALRAWLARRGSAGLDVDDLVQETYAVLAAMASVEHIAAPRAYAFRTAHSLVLRHLRRAEVVRIEAVEEATLHATPDDEPGPEQQVAAREELARVRAVIDALPDKCREAFTLRRIEGLSQRDIAGRMGIAESTVEKHIGRALRALMDAFAYGGNQGAPASEKAEKERAR